MERRGRTQDLFCLLLCWLMVGPVQAQVPVQVPVPVPAPVQAQVLAPVRHPLPVLWMMPLGFGGFGSRNVTAGVAPAVRLALQDLKNQPGPLGDYEIQLHVLDSQCDPAKALKHLFDAMWAGPKYLLLFGGVCPAVTALIGRALPALNLVQVSFAASSPALAHRKLYGSVFSTVPSDRALNQATVRILQHYGWSRVGLLSQDRPRLPEMKKDLVRQLLKAKVEVAASEGFSEDVCSSLKELKNHDVRIIIGLFEDDSASEVFCCAYRLNLFGPRYQWIVAGARAAGWRLGWRSSGCTTDSLMSAADGSIGVQIRTLSYSNTAGVSGRTPQDYEDSYLRQVAIQERSEVGVLHAFAYDAVWVAAGALSRATEALRHRDKYHPLRNVTLREEEVNKQLLDALRKTHFQGVTGSVSFRNGERMMSIDLVQIQGSTSVLVGDFSVSSQQLRLKTNLMKFRGSGPPRDGVVVRVQPGGVSLLLYAVVSSFGSVCVLVTLAALGRVTIRNRKRMLTSDPGSHLQLLLVGLLLCSSSVLLSGLDGAAVSERTFEGLCSGRLWTLCLGHTLSVTVLVGWSWTIYSVSHTRQKFQSRPLPSCCFSFPLILLDLLILTLWQILDPLRRVVLQHSEQSGPADQLLILQSSSEICSSQKHQLWISVVCVYKAPLLVFGCLLAWRIRTVDVDRRRLGGKLVALNVFVVTVFSVSGLVGALLTYRSPPVHFCVSAALVLLWNAFVLMTMFGPKVSHVWWSSSELKEEEEDEVEEEEEEEEEDEEQLQLINQHLKSLTAQLDFQIETFSMQLREMFDSERFPMGRRYLLIKPVTHEAQVCPHHRTSERRSFSPGDINSPEQVRRRLSVQLPILHHSYLPVVGGLSSSSSSLFGSQEAFVYHYYQNHHQNHHHPVLSS